MESQATTSSPGPVDTTDSPHARWRTLPFGSTNLTDGFWTRRLDVNRRVSLRHAYHMLEEAGNLHDLRLAAGRATGAYRGPVFMDSDVYKWLEAVAYELAKEPDAELQAMADSAVELVAAAQGPDGYLNSYWQVVEPDRRWQDLSHGHELYCLGHLIQAAVAFHRGTGDARLLDVSGRFADYVDSVFGPGKRPGTPGHPEVEMALVELYRETRERRYLDLARFFVDQRGHGILGNSRFGGSAYFQDRVPVREADAVEGHAVRALYLTSGVADLYLETGEEALLAALQRQWTDMTTRKMYVTGGVGSRHQGEAFGEPYELPNERAYCETCAAIASIMWSWRMLLATGEGRFADVLERALYNAVLSGISLDGQRYFYVNPLLSYGVDSAMGRKTAERALWHSCACCPPNVMRLFASLSHYLATRDDRGLQVHLYVPGTIEAELGLGRPVALRVATEYPWQGRVRFTVERTDGQAWPLSLRLPEWCAEPGVEIDGRRQPLDLTGGEVKNGYVVLERAWREGDVVDLVLPMEPRLTEAHPRVDPARGSVAVERGPLVYCLEQRDQEDSVDVLDVALAETAELRATWRPDLLEGVVTVEASGQAVDTSAWEGKLYRPIGAASRPSRRPVRLVAVPYYAWANRGATAMRVWVPRAGLG